MHQASILLYMAMIYHFNNYFSQTNMGLFLFECIHKFLLQRELEDLDLVWLFLFRPKSFKNLSEAFLYMLDAK